MHFRLPMPLPWSREPTTHRRLRPTGQPIPCPVTPCVVESTTHNPTHLRPRRPPMPFSLYQLAYTPESIAAQIQSPQDRLEVVGRQLTGAGVTFLAGGYSF